jgi:hypothetical protein
MLERHPSVSPELKRNPNSSAERAEPARWRAEMNFNLMSDAALKKWNSEEAAELVSDLASATDRKDCTKLWNRVSYLLVHDRWYTKEQIQAVISAARESKGLSNKQKQMNLPLTRDDDEDWNGQYAADQDCCRDETW